MQTDSPGESEGSSSREAIEAIVEQVKAGDVQAYNAIRIHFDRQMYTYCYYIMKNHTDKESTLQQHGFFFNGRLAYSGGSMPE